ncbi:hypothetical protein GCM10022377_04960 [Zhihengliuella alba]|uniref:Hemoglobin n=1 Tax=Zhihengliuella alba TaxID=547018 RepID=A0ABP7CRB1_9MICC
MDLSQHTYEISLEWTGARGTGTQDYRSYGRDHVVRAAGLPDLPGTADPTFHGDKDRWNPEQLLLAALSQCHMLSYLHIAVKRGVVVTGYTDEAAGTLRLNRDGSGEFTEAVLRPRVTLADEAQRELADTLHAEANRVCFIARSVNFPVQHEPVAPEPERSEDPDEYAGTFYAQIGGKETFRRLAAKFYEGVAADPEFRAMYPEEDLGPAAERLQLFLEQYWGGPKTYSETRGHPRLRMRHMPYKVNSAARDKWLAHMRAAVESLELPPLQHEVLWDYLERAAHSLVNTPDQPHSQGLRLL